ncbi:MAG: hypothetical protein AVDCRST_MAG01-01-5178 [uncultured Rubrobacteraceae bacterium]|uniref:HTH cro/C1-type domain-containing protein n=1 Tax=uncultured Rubrobacteraceae bacterium TaxID=349277 RepID=A0A6J4QV30_9ACTN|nr:MAG: hypothetical protein AVDCRST_MAG01-01-5178 [uncultured Rubrobacteraceae bacterium]
MEEVRRLRLAKGWNQNELAFHADLAPSVISLLETGKREPNATTLRKLAEALEVRIPDLFEDSGSGKASRRSSPEPSLFNGIEDQRRSSRFAKAIFATVDKCVVAMTTSDTDPRTAAGMVDVLLVLHESVFAPMDDDAVRQTLTDEEGDEILAVSERLIEAATTGIQRLEEAAEDADQEEDAKRMRERIREMTRRISA